MDSAGTSKRRREPEPENWDWVEETVEKEGNAENNPSAEPNLLPNANVDNGIEENATTSTDVEGEPPRLTNFFEFGSKPLPDIQKNVPNKMDGPPAKVPRQAHYNCHNEEQEVRYASQVKTVPILGHENSSDSEDETTAPNEQPDQRYSRRDKVLTKYNFNYRRYPDLVNLAAYGHKEKIVEAITNHRVVVIEGFTGCGKTTQVPQFIMDKYVQSGRSCNIVVTQPRRIAAVSVARRVCEERGWEVGTVCGYQVGRGMKRDKFDTMINYMTTGVLLQKLISQKSLKEWTHIVIDEVHERDLETDFLLLIIKKILLDDREGKEKHVKIILMSATLNADQFSRYYVTQRSEFVDAEEAPIVRIPYPSTKRFVVEEKFLDDIIRSEGPKPQEELDEIYGNMTQEKAGILPSIYDIAVDTIVSFDEKERLKSLSEHDPRRKSANVMRDLKVESRGSVLVFLPGLQEIEQLFKFLTQKNRQANNGGDPDYYKWTIVPLHSSITAEEQSRVFEPPVKGRRKIILSTNIAESSITVPDIIYVIDFCLTKSLSVDARTNFSCLRMCWASISQCIQRKGRTGRVGNGLVYRLVPKKFFGELDQHAQPEMLKSSLESVVLRVKTLDLGTPKDILALAIDPPQLSGIERAVVNLKEVGALTLNVTRDGQVTYDTCDGDLTYMGKIMAIMPIPLQCTRLILLGHVFGVMSECIIIAAGLSVKSPFSSPFQKQLESYQSRLEWAKRTHSDCFAILHVYKHWIARYADSSDVRNSMRQERVWARGSFVQVPVLREMRSLVEELQERIKGFQIVENRLRLRSDSIVDEENSLSKEQSLMIKVAIAGAFYPNYFHRLPPDPKTYERERSREVCGYDLFSTVYFKGFPPGHNGKLYAKHIADKLKVGLDVPVIKFEGSKVLAVFNNTAQEKDKIGPINVGVYRAVKLRQLRDPIEFNVLWKENELEYLNRAEDFLASRRFYRCPKQIDLPGIDVPSVYVVVTHVESPSQFWVIYAQHKDFQEWIVNAVNMGLSRQSLPNRELTAGAFCLAPFRDNSEKMTYYRAKIISLNQVEEALVYYVDYGNSDWVPTKLLEPFSAAHVQASLHIHPCLAVECRLSNVKPAIVYGSVWHVDAINNFRNFVNEIPMVRMKIYAVVKSVIIGEVIGEDTENRSLNVNHKVRTEGFGDFAPESYICGLNHSARERYDIIRDDVEQVNAHNLEQKAEPLDLTFIEPPADAQAKVELKGCWSPLELDFQSLCHSSSSKQVMIDQTSVNSVVLDHEPTAPTSRLLVASNVAIQDRSGRVVARDTTMMPAVPGLMALMAMLFTSKIELRADQKHIRYTGVLCGLGTDPSPIYGTETEPPAIYQDHDLEIIFDTQIDDDDVFMINKVRYFMNLILRESPGLNMSSIHKEIVEEIFKILKKERKRVDEECWPQESYMWNRIKPSFIKPPPPNTFPLEPTDVFLPHNTIGLLEETPSVATWGDWAV